MNKQFKVTSKLASDIGEHAGKSWDLFTPLTTTLMRITSIFLTDMDRKFNTCRFW